MCDEERTGTETGRGIEFPFMMGKELPRNKMTVGVERNTAKGSRCNNRQGGATTGKTAAVGKHSPAGTGDAQKRGIRPMELSKERRSKLPRSNPPQETAIVLELGDQEGEKNPSLV